MKSRKLSKYGVCINLVYSEPIVMETRFGELLNSESIFIG